ncbi:MAG: DUF2029 domain-containing protein [Bdellovibrionales bacterium]|nr:DUF2029 domain-containing protein [Bdellovibrionales bacterium]
MSLSRKLVLIFASCCLLLAIIATVLNIPGQDAAAYLTSGKLVNGSHFDIYPSVTETSWSVSDSFKDEYCQIAKTKRYSCEDMLVAYISPPPMLLITALIAGVPGTLGLHIFQILSALALALGTTALFLDISKRDPNFARPLAITFLLLLPFSVHAIEHGQTSAWIFLLVVLGLELERESALTIFSNATLLVCATASKLTPFAFLGVLLIQKKWKTTVAALTLLALSILASLCLFPSNLYLTFLEILPRFSEQLRGNTYNVSIDSALFLLHSKLGFEFWVPKTLSLLKGGAVAAVILLAIFRNIPFRDFWLLCWLAWMAILPVVWWHYHWITVASLGGLVGVGRESSQQNRYWLFALWCAPLSLGYPQLLAAHPVVKIFGAAFIAGSFAWGARMVLGRKHSFGEDPVAV